MTAELLGEGSFSRVELVSDTTAIKKFNRSNDFCAIRELAILHSINHKNIINVSSASVDSDNTVRLYMKAYPMTLDSSEYKNLATPTQMYSVIYDLLMAVKYLHGKKILHRDIKPANVLYSPQDKRAVLCDFNISIFVPETLKKLYGRVQSLHYRAPEINMEEYAYYGKPIDIYSVGVISFELGTGESFIRNPGSCAVTNIANAFGVDIYCENPTHERKLSLITPMTINQSKTFLIKRCPSADPRWMEFCSRLVLPDSSRRLDAVQSLVLVSSFLGKVPPEVTIKEEPLFVTAADPEDVKKTIDEKTQRITEVTSQIILIQSAALRQVYISGVMQKIGPFYRKWVRIIEIDYYRVNNRQKIMGSAEDLKVVSAIVYIVWSITNDSILLDDNILKSYEKALDILVTIDWKALY